MHAFMYSTGRAVMDGCAPMTPCCRPHSGIVERILARSDVGSGLCTTNQGADDMMGVVSLPSIDLRL